MPEPETAFLLRRAEEEAVLAISADRSVAAYAHQELSRRYSIKALDALAKEHEPHPGETA